MKKICLIICILLGMTTQAQEKETLVLIKTSLGDITVKLYNDTPLHRDNFIKLINEGWYNNSPFHRVINNFMIQGGHNQDGSVDPGYTIPAEFRSNHIHKKGALAAARQGDISNPRRESSGSQFYIVHDPAHCVHLDGAYTIFGETLSGFEVIDKIAALRTNRYDQPLKDVRIISINPV
jgi:peptidyl-prolyl cis-trans isomerase B (cyclophilin B)